MGKEYTEKSRFKSNYTDKYIPDAQYLAEMICERLAAKEKTTLPQQFWNIDKWKKVFLAQLSHANKLLKEYDVFSISAALKDYRCKWLHSLGLKSVLVPVVKEYAARQTKEKKDIKEEIPLSNVDPAVRREPVKKKNPLGEL